MSASKSFRSFSMPLGMVVGALFCRQIVWVDAALQGMLTPIFIFTMLFFTFCRVDARKIRFSWMHLWLLLFQIVGSVGVYFALSAMDVVLAQGAMICVLAPVAMATVVIGGMLGANVESMVAYSLLCNVAMESNSPRTLHYLNNLARIPQLANSGVLHNQFGVTYDRARNYVKAYNSFLKARQLDKNNPAILLNSARFYDKCYTNKILTRHIRKSDIIRLYQDYLNNAGKDAAGRVEAGARISKYRKQ